MKHGAIIESNISISSDERLASEQATRVHQILNGQKLHEITSHRWSGMLRQGLAGTDGADESILRELARYLGDMLGGQ